MPMCVTAEPRLERGAAGMQGAQQDLPAAASAEGEEHIQGESPDPSPSFMISGSTVSSGGT